MRRSRAGRALAALLLLACCGALCYAAVALAAPARHSKAPLPQQALEQIEAKVRAAQKFEVRAYNEFHNGRLEDGQRQLHASKVALVDAKEILGEHGFGDSQPVFDINRAGTSDLTASMYVRENPKLALEAIDTALKRKREVLSELPKLAIRPPTSSKPTVTGEADPGTEPSTLDYAITPGAPINAYRLVDTSGWDITPKFVPKGWSCTNTTEMTVVCKGPLTSTPFTGILSYTGTAPPTVSAAGSNDGGKTFGPSAKLASPTPTTPITVTVSCPSGVAAGQSIVVTITVQPPDSPITDLFTLPDGSTDTHTAIVDSTGTKASDAIAAPPFDKGLWHLRVTTPHGGSGGCDIPVN